jgi:hypothetical protein
MSMDNRDFVPQNIETFKDLSVDFLSGLTTKGGNRFYDNSTLDSFRVCPRRFYYRHIRHWETDTTKTALIFGTCWHAAMDFVWANPSCSSEQAFGAFMQEWNKSDLINAESFDLFPRSPQRASEMLTIYLERYQNWLQSIEVVAIEKAFIVPLSTNAEYQNLFYVGKWDKLYKEHGRYTITDHKTASSFANTWLNGWSPNGQIDGYLYAGHMEYGDDFRNVIIDGALVQKTKMDFIKIPVERQLYMLEQWKWEVIDLIQQIWFYESDLLQLRNQKPEDFLRAYPKCTTSCNSYYGSCPYLNLCKFVPNPELIETVPDGFIITNWKPFNVAEDVDGKFIVHHTHGD